MCQFAKTRIEEKTDWCWYPVRGLFPTYDNGDLNPKGLLHDFDNQPGLPSVLVPSSYSYCTWNVNVKPFHSTFDKLSSELTPQQLIDVLSL